MEIDAPPEIVYAAIRHADLHDPIIDVLFTLRELPTRLSERMRGIPTSRTPEVCTFEDLAKTDMPWMLLAEDRGSQLVIGSVGNSWRADYGLERGTAEDFASFNEPGYADSPSAFRSGPPTGRPSCVTRRRIATTDETARAFRRYWRLIRLGDGIVRHRALSLIKAEAERHAASQLVQERAPSSNRRSP